MEVQPSDIKIKAVLEKQNTGVYSIEPLPKGFGNTLGNALRRVLLTSIPGAAVTQMKVKGITHQFSTIKGVKEDAVELSLNLKQLRFAIHSNGPVVATISKKGKGVVTAKDIETSSDLEVLNKSLHIATLSDAKSSLDIELIVEPGVGYSPMEERPTSKVGVVVLDALFTPVIRAKYDVEPTRFGKSVDLDKIILEVETDGSINPQKALHEAARIVKDYFKIISTGGIWEEDEEEAVILEGVKPISSEKANIVIEDLPLQTRTVNALKKSGVKTLGELAKKTDEDLADIKNLGEKSLNEIKKLLEKENLE